MATLKQQTAFGPGRYRGHEYSRERLLRFVEGTNKAIAAGVPIPLIIEHAPVNAGDKETQQYADRKGAGWIKSVFLGDDGSLGWEADNVSDEHAKEAQEGRLRFTSPEFRESYTCETEGVYEGPIIRHIAAVTTPANVNQGEITVALGELPELGVFQFAEEEKEPLEAEAEQHAEDDYHKLLEQHGYKQTGKSNIGGGWRKYGKKHEEITIGQSGGWHRQVKHVPGASEGLFVRGDDATGLAAHLAGKKSKHPSGHYIQHSEEVEQFADNRNRNQASDDAALAAALNNTTGIPADSLLDPALNPDMPPVATDRTKLAAIISGLATKGIVLPSDWDWQKPGGLDILLGCLNTNIKTEQDIEAEQALNNNMEDLPVTQATMPFSEYVDFQFAEIKNPNSSGQGEDEGHKKHPLHSALEAGGYKYSHTTKIHRSEGKQPYHLHTYKSGDHNISLYADNSHLWDASKGGSGFRHKGSGAEALTKYLKYKNKGQQHSEEAVEQFSEEELAAMSPKARAAIEAGQRALQAEREAKVAEQQKAAQFAEEAKREKDNNARTTAVTTVKTAKIPPGLKTILVQQYGEGEQQGVVQFSEGLEQPVYTPSQVAKLVEQTIPQHLQFDENGVATSAAQKENYFAYNEQGTGMTPERAEEIASQNPMLNNAKTPKPNQHTTRGQQVARMNGDGDMSLLRDNRP